MIDRNSKIFCDFSKYCLIDYFYHDFHFLRDFRASPTIRNMNKTTNFLDRPK